MQRLYGQNFQNNEKISLLTRNLKVNDLTMRQLKKEAKELSAALDDMTESANPEEYAKLNTRLREVRARMSELRSAGNNMNNEFGNSVNWMSKLKWQPRLSLPLRLSDGLRMSITRHTRHARNLPIRGSPPEYFPVAEEG